MSRDIYRASDNMSDTISINRNHKNDDTMVLGFEEIDIIIDDLQALDIMKKLASFFNYELVDLDA